MAGDRKLALITGAAGFVGSRIARRFLREGMSVRALDQRPIDVAEVESCVGDVTDPGVAHRATGGSRVGRALCGRHLRAPGRDHASQRRGHPCTA